MFENPRREGYDQIVEIPRTRVSVNMMKGGGVVRRTQLIVGASAAGVSAALGMREAGYEGGIVLVDADPHLPYERPPLSKSLAGGSPSALKPIVPEQLYSDKNIELCLGTAVSALRPADRKVELTDGSVISADHVTLAVGLAARRLPVPGIDKANVLTLRDAADSLEIISRLNAGGPLVILGAGFIGLELAAVAVSSGIEVTVIELAPAPLAPILGLELGRLVERLHRERGVRFIFGRTISELVGDAEVEFVVLDDGTRLAASTVVIGVGTLPRDQLAVDAGIACERGVRVDEHGLTSNRWVSAAGDIANQPHPALDTPGRIEHWDVAMRHGRAVGMSAVGVGTVADDVPYAWSDQYDLTLQMFGRGGPHDTLVVQRGARPDRFLAFWQRDGRVRAVAGLNMPKEVRAGRTLVERGSAVPSDLLRDDQTDLRALGRQSVSRRD